MTAKETAHSYRLRQWAEIICECKASGKKVTTWCEEHGINTKTYYCWQKRVREAACEQLTLKGGAGLPALPASEVSAFAEYRLPLQKIGGAAVTLHISGATVEINNGADAAVIENTLRVLKSIC